MSEFIDNADSLKAYIETLPGLDGIDVIVDRQKDIATKIKIGVAKTKGAVIDILWLGGVPTDPDGAPNLNCRYRINVRTKPVLRTDTQVKADEVCKKIVLALWHWRSNENDHCYDEWKIIDVDLMPDGLLIYQIIAEVNTELREE